MAHRLSKIATRTGDAGETGLGDGTRVPKDSARVQTLGDIDELNSAIGVLLAEDVPQAVRAALEQVQQDCLDLGGEVSIPGHTMVARARCAARTRGSRSGIATSRRSGNSSCRRIARRGGGAPGAYRVPARRAQPGRARAARAGGERARQYLNRLSDLLSSPAVH